MKAHRPLVALLGGMASLAVLAPIPASAQTSPAPTSRGPQTTGVLGSPSATTTIDGQTTSAAAAEIRRRDQGDCQEFQALVAAARRAAQGRAQRAAHHDRRPGLWRQRHVRRRHPDAGAGPDRQGGAALHAVPLHRALLADAGSADHRPQPPLGRLRRDLGAVDRLSRATTRYIGPENATIGTILRDNGYATSWFGKNHNTPGFQYSARVPSTNGRPAWASTTSTASWAARPTSGRRICSAITPRSFRGSASPATTSPPTWRTRRSST